MAHAQNIAALLFFALVARPVLLIATGLRVTGRAHLPRSGPAVVVANHNSHLDVIALMSLFPLRLLPKLRPVAAADHFSRPGFIGWFARVLLNVIAIDRSGGGAETAIAPVRAALDDGEIVILFPEGSRGAPEVLAAFRRGTSVLAAEYPDVAFVPVYLHGLGKTLPRGEWRFVPFASEAYIGPPRTAAADHGQPMAERLQADIAAMAKQTPLAGFADD